MLKENKKVPEMIKNVFVSIATIVVFALAVLVSIKSTYNPFIYFNF